VDVDSIAEGLWRWTARHPDWTPGEDWDPVVACAYYEAPDAIVLVDPLVPSEEDDRERLLRALDRDVEQAGLPLAVVLTIFWHARSADELARRYDGTVWAHAPAAGRAEADVTDAFELGDALPGGIEALDAGRRGEVVFWIPPHRTLVTGDVLLGDEKGGLELCPEDWLDGDEDRARVLTSLQALRALPVERILPAHGVPVLEDAPGALARALA
jgi:glyoxylase-like metal-dependent hydrolase (beta-lactamase superfamily II)